MDSILHAIAYLRNTFIRKNKFFFEPALTLIVDK